MEGEEAPPPQVLAEGVMQSCAFLGQASQIEERGLALDLPAQGGWYGEVVGPEHIPDHGAHVCRGAVHIQHDAACDGNQLSQPGRGNLRGAVRRGQSPPHFLEGGDVGSGKQYALLAGDLVGDHVTALLCNQKVGHFVILRIQIGTFNKEIRLRNFSLSKILRICTDSFEQVFVVALHHLRHIPAVNDLLAVEVKNFQFVHLRVLLIFHIGEAAGAYPAMRFLSTLEHWHFAQARRPLPGASV